MIDARKTCFVLMPFAEKYRKVYDQVYKPACAENDLRCWRVDEITGPGSITRDIVEGIIDADIIIADLTTQNPNVFYELGIAHAMGNKTLTTCQRIEEVPFDIANYRVILYEQTIAGSKALAERLSAAIDELLAALDRTNNPVQSVLGGRASLHFRRRTPLFKAVDVNLFTPAVKALLNERGIVYVDELRSLDLDELARTSGFGRSSVSQLAYLISAYELYSDPEDFYRVLQEHGVRLASPPDPYSRDKWYSFVNSINSARRSI